MWGVEGGLGFKDPQGFGNPGGLEVPGCDRQPAAVREMGTALPPAIFEDRPSVNRNAPAWFNFGGNSLYNF